MSKNQNTYNKYHLIIKYFFIYSHNLIFHKFATKPLVNNTISNVYSQPKKNLSNNLK